MKKVLAVVAASLVLWTQPVWAMRTRVHEMAESPRYGQKAAGMVGRGLLNGVTCFVDPIVNIVNETKAGPPVVGTLTGVGKGLGCGVLRLGSGLVDVVTFWVPGFNGFPVSDSYTNCMEGSTAASSAPAAYSEPAPMAEPSQPAPSTWETPAAEPESQKPASHPVKPKRTWTK